ncbi:endo-1,4-beta-xylanase 3-like [Haliotis rubra]|uniref:endo-1,4-beta-xylanase 3-like n=1 Tax=Haliotis rubra TaxID=36100 RepID=UPI001EE52CDE|nr:endo-1,4-beta-xylanase 3-like [Haliotis rubra]
MWRCVRLAALTLPFCLSMVGGAAEIFKNPGFESTNPLSSWECVSCHMAVASDHTEGRHSLKVSARTNSRSGIRQNVALRDKTRYSLQSYVKQLTNPTGKLYQHYMIQLDVTRNNGSTEYIRTAFRSVTSHDGWVQLRSDFVFYNEGYRRVSLRLNNPDAGVDFLVDHMSLTEIPEDKDWKSKADKRIDQLRKNNIHFNIQVPPHVSYADLVIQVDLVKHGFSFGSQTNTKTLSLDPHYADLFYYLFNFATVNDYYWHTDPKPLHNPDYSAVSKTLDELHKHGINVRGHTIFWGTHEQWVPDWVRALTPSQVEQAVDERIQYIVKDTKGKLQQWDVNNELVRGHWFEEKTRDRFYTHKMFAKVHQADPSVKLFLNDNNVVATGFATTAYVVQAKEFKAANVGLYGLGIQCHFLPYTAPDPTLMKRRLDMLATTGLPLWVTELDVVASTENIRADWYDTALRMLFSHPDVEGIILWGFWDLHHWRGKEAALVNGPNFHVNAAGKRYIDLLYKEWSTHVTHKVSSGTQFNVRGFHGDYRVVVKYHGNPVMQQTFTLGKQDKQVNIQITDVNHHINIPTTKSPIDYHRVISHPVAHINEHSMGQKTSGTSSKLTCVSAFSGFSQVGNDKMTEVGCASGYVLTGCLGKIKDNRNTRDGEAVYMQNGNPLCQTYEGSHATAPAQATARCCKLTGLKCDYRKSGVSQGVLDQRLETQCLNNMFATGCTSHNSNEHTDGAFPSSHSCFAQNSENYGGVTSYAMCCSAPNLTCQVKTSKPTGNKLGDVAGVSCDSGWQLVGCSGFSEDGKVGGAYIKANPDQCVAVNGAERLWGEMGVTAFATCCRPH